MFDGFHSSHFLDSHHVFNLQMILYSKLFFGIFKWLAAAVFFPFSFLSWESFFFHFFLRCSLIIIHVHKNVEYWKIQETATVPVRTALFVSVSLAGVSVFVLCVFFEDFLEESFHFLSLASSISICSCLHSWLQNGVFPLHSQ